MIIAYLTMLLVGLSLGLMGGGGSILTVPILVYLFGISPVQATGYSLFIVGIVSLVGVGRYLQKGEINMSRGLAFGLPGLAGIWLSRAVILPSIPEKISSIGEFLVTKDLLVMVVFATLMITASISMIRGRKEKEQTPPNLIFLGFLGFVVSVITGFVGAGGGFLIVPALALIGGLRMKAAVGTSLFVVTINSLFGFGTDVFNRSYELNWEVLILSSSIALVGLFLGIQVAEKVPDKKLKKAFGVFVFCAGLLVIYQQIFS